MMIDDELAAKLDGLRQQFASGLPRRLDAIDAAIAACRADPDNETALGALRTVLHSLGGAAGIFGFAELGVQIKTAEQTVVGWLDGGNGSRQGIDQLAMQLSVWRQLS